MPTEAALHSAAATVGPAGGAFASGVSPSSFELVTRPALAGRSTSNVTGGRPAARARGKSPSGCGRRKAGAHARGDAGIIG